MSVSVMLQAVGSVCLCDVTGRWECLMLQAVGSVCDVTGRLGVSVLVMLHAVGSVCDVTGRWECL